MSVDRLTSEPTAAPGMPSLPRGFTDEVMLAVGRAPRPSPTRAFRSAMKDRSIADANAALSVAWRISRLSASMPAMVRAQALALVVFVAGSMLGGGALAGVVAYQAVRPIVHAIAEGAGDRDRDDRPEVALPTAAPPAVPQPTPIAVEPTEPAVATPDQSADEPATRVGSTDPTEDAIPEDDADQNPDVPDADEDDADMEEGDGDPGMADEAVEPEDAAHESAEDAASGGSEEPDDDAVDADARADEADPSSDEPAAGPEPDVSTDSSEGPGGD